MDPTAEGPGQLPDDYKEIYSLVETLEEILRDLPETCEARTPAAPQAQLCVPATGGTSALTSQPMSVQSQAVTPQRPMMMISEGSSIPGIVLDQNLTTLPVKALDMLSGDLSGTFSMDHKVTSFDQGKPTATSWITDINDNANNMTISNEGSQMKTLSDEHNLDGGHTTISGDHTHYGGQTTFSGNQVHYGGQTTISGDQTHYGGQTTISGDHTHYGGQITFSGNQVHYGGQTTISGDQTHYGGQTTFSGNQIHYGGQMTFSGNQTHYGVQMPFSGNQVHYGGQMTISGDQTHYGGQTTAFKGSYAMTFINDQIFTGGQMTTHSGNHALCGSQMVSLKRGQTPFTDDCALSGSHMMPCQLTSLPYSGFLYFSSSHYTQGQSLEKQKSKLKTPKNLDILKPHACTYQDCGKSYSKRSLLQIHERKHTGEKPYKCNVKGCTWEFARSDELSRHNRKHSGERPYLCTVCNKYFARSDHLKQHQRVHNL